MCPEASFLCGHAHSRARRQWSWCWASCARITSLLSRMIGCRSTRPLLHSIYCELQHHEESGKSTSSSSSPTYLTPLHKKTNKQKRNRKNIFTWVCAFSFYCTGGFIAEWPRARQTRRARRLSLRANTSSLMEYGCHPSAEGRWRRLPTSPSEVATYGLSPTQSQVHKPLRHVLCSARFLAVCFSLLQQWLQVSLEIIKVTYCR